MSGHVVYTPPPGPHRCHPGWTYRSITDPTLRAIAVDAGLRPVSALPPSVSQYPAGTVWECSCGKRWISRGVPAVPWRPGGGYTVRMVEWKREGFWARRRRLRASVRAYGGAVVAMHRDPDSVVVKVSDGGRLENPYGDHRSPPEDQGWLEMEGVPPKGPGGVSQRRQGATGQGTVEE